MDALSTLSLFSEKAFSALILSNNQHHLRLNLSIANAITKNKMIQTDSETNAKYTSGLSSPHPLAKIDLRAVVACVNGKPCDMYLQHYNSLIVKNGE